MTGSLTPHGHPGNTARLHARVAGAQVATVLSSVHQRWRKYNPYLIALAIYGSSRLVVVWAIYVAAQFLLPAEEDRPFAPIWYHYLLRWDSTWYATIVNEGYKYNGNDFIQQNVVFYPLYPLIAKPL